MFRRVVQSISRISTGRQLPIYSQTPLYAHGIRYNTDFHPSRINTEKDLDKWFTTGLCDTYKCNDFLTYFVKAKKHVLAIKLYELMKGEGYVCKPNTKTYNQLLLHFNKKMPYKALDLFEEMIERNVTPDVISFSLFLASIRQSGELHRIDDALSDMNNAGIPLNITIYSTIIDTYLKAKKPAKATELLEQMQREGISPTAHTYNMIISYHCNNENIPRALQMIEELHSREEIEPNIVFFNTILTSKQKVSIEDAFHFAKQIESKGVQWDLRTYNLLLSGCTWRVGAVADETKAKSLLQKMKEKGIKPDVFTYNTMLSILPHETGRILRRMRDDGIPYSCVTYSILIRNNRKNVAKVMGIVAEMNKNNIRTDLISFNLIIAALCKSRRFEEAKLTLKQMKEERVMPNASTYNNFIFVFLREGNVPAAVEILKEMKDNSVPMNSATYAYLIRYYLVQKELDTAGMLFEQMKDEKVPPFPQTNQLWKRYTELVKRKEEEEQEEEELEIE